MKEGQYELLLIEKIHLDRKNPRLAVIVEMYGEDIPAEQIALALEVGGDQKGASFLSLKQSIRTNGGIIHPIIVNS